MLKLQKILEELRPPPISSPWRILHILPTLEVGGTESWLGHLLPTMNKHQFENIVISLGEIGPIGNQLQQNGITVIALGIHPKRPNPFRLLRLLHIMRKFKPDIISGWLYHGNCISALLGKCFKVPVVWNIRQCLPEGYCEKKISLLFLRLGVKLGNIPYKILYNSYTSAQQHEKIGFPANKTDYFLNDANTKIFSPSLTAYQEVREELNLASNTILIGLVARFHPVKGHRVFLEAAKFILESFPNIHFLLIGTGITWQNQELKFWIDEFHLPYQQIHLLGEQPSSLVARYTAALDIATSSSFAEARSNTLLEAISCNVSCVATHVGDTAKIFEDTAKNQEKQGIQKRRNILVPPQNAIELAKGWSIVLQDLTLIKS